MIFVPKDFYQVPEGLRSSQVEREVQQLLVNRPKLDETRLEYYLYPDPVTPDPFSYLYHGKCARCEVRLGEKGGRIQRYRPYRPYYWLAYEWSNIFPVCHDCGIIGSFPFEIKGELVKQPQHHRHEWLANSQTLLAEQLSLLHQEIDDPEDFLYVDPEGLLWPKNNHPRGEYTIDKCKLNRPSLVAARSAKINWFFDRLQFRTQQLSDYFATFSPSSSASQALHQITFEETFEQLRQSAEASAEYALVGRNMIKDFDRFFTDRLPSQDQRQILHDAYWMSTSSPLIRTPSRLVFHTSNDQSPLPCAIQQLQVENYRGIHHTGITDLPLDAQWIFLTGENSFGKTSVLQAIAMGLFGRRDGNRILGDERMRIEIEFLNRSRHQMNHTDLGFKPLTHLAAYGPSRLEIQTDQSKGEIEGKSSTLYGLFHTDGVLLNIEQKLVLWYLKKDPKYQSVIDLLQTCLPHIRKIYVTDQDEIVYEEHDAGTPESGDHPVSFSQLAAGNRSIVAMIGDIVSRFYKTQPDVTDPKDFMGIVLIDELELHLHPKWQRELPTMLSTVFPKVQFIASTHSVIPFLGAPEGSVFLKVNRTAEAGIELERVDIDITNLLPNTLLSSPLFDLDNLTQVNNRELSNVRTEDTYADMLSNDEIGARLKAFTDSGQDYPDNLFEP